MRKHTLGNADSLIKFFRTVPMQTYADAVIITGDLIDYYQADTEDNGRKMLANQVEQFNAVCAFCPVPIYSTLGNHDISSYWINPDDSSKIETQAYADMARASWIRNTACFKEGTYYEKSLMVGGTKYHLIFLDNGYHLHEGSKTIDKTQLDWLQKKMYYAGDDPVLLFFHIYFPVGDINGDSIYFNNNKSADWPTKDDCKDGLLKIINEHPNIKAMFVGHQHNDVWEAIHFPAGQMVYQIMTPALFKSAKNFKLITFENDKIIISKLRIAGNEIVINLK